LPPTAVIEVEVYAAPTMHKVPMKALQRWASSLSPSPKDELIKRPMPRV
jgi:hypothetical protein